MQKQLLSYISDEDLIKHTTSMVQAVSNAKQRIEKNIHRGVIDPFSAIVDSSVQSISFDKWLEQEKARKIQKALQNALGDFHQNILGSVTGWENAGQGGSYDVRNKDKKIIAEIKNKYNTLNSEGLLSVYDKLSNHLDYGDPDYTAYYVAVVPKGGKAYNETFAPVKKKIARQTRKDLRKIDGKSFYALASGQPNALEQLYAVLPTLLEQQGYALKNDELKYFNDLFKRAYSKNK